MTSSEIPSKYTLCILVCLCSVQTVVLAGKHSHQIAQIIEMMSLSEAANGQYIL